MPTAPPNSGPRFRDIMKYEPPATVRRGGGGGEAGEEGEQGEDGCSMTIVAGPIVPTVYVCCKRC